MKFEDFKAKIVTSDCDVKIPLFPDRVPPSVSSPFPI